MTEIKITKPGVNPYKSILVYGPTGAGKTRFGISAESTLGGRTLVIATESSEAQPDPSTLGFDVDITYVRDMEEFKAVLKFLQLNPGKYAVGVVDSLSQLAKFGLAADAENEFKRGNTRTPLNIPLDAYKRVGEDIRRSMWMARTLPMHWVYVCLDRVFVSEDNTVRMVGPNLTESLSGDVRAYCDVVGYMTAENMEVETKDGKREARLVRRLFLQPSGDFYARVRAGRDVEVPQFIVSPSLPKLLDILKVKEGKK